MMEQFATIHEARRKIMGTRSIGKFGQNLRKNQVKFLFWLETKFQGNDERIVNLSKHQALSKSMCDLIAVDNVCLPTRL